MGQVCYDSFGPSIGITKIYFGQFAADRLSQNLSRSSSRDFQLSSGQACSISMRTCWNDGWNAQNKDKRLTRQLFDSTRLSRSPMRTSRWPSSPGSAASARRADPCSMDPAISSRW